MIGLAFRKLAAEYGMRVSHGIAYGSIKGYTTTLFEGSTDQLFAKVLIVTTNTDDKLKIEKLSSGLNYLDTQEMFGVSDIQVSHNTIVVNFFNKPGMMKKIRLFINWFYPILKKCDFAGDNICPECGNELNNGQWKRIGYAAYHLHAGCAYGAESKVRHEYEEIPEEDTSTYGKGLIGALLGALLGAILWGITFPNIIFAIIVSTGIGVLVDKGYNLFNGKQGKGKIAILIISILFGVIMGALIAYELGIVRDIGIRTLLADYKQIPTLLFDSLKFDKESLWDLAIYLIPGLLLAGIGSFSYLRIEKIDVTAYKTVDLE